MAIDPTAKIHPSAVVEDGAVIGANVEVGAFTLIGPEVTVADGCLIKSHVVLTGWTELGPDCEIYPFASVGEVPQDLKFAGERTQLIIGARTRIREHVTVNTGTVQGGGVTRIGEDCLLMAGCHVAHDAQIGNKVIIVNASQVAGHCIIEDEVLIGALAGVHQFARVGRGAIIGAMAKVTNDVMPHGLVQGPKGELEGLNLVGLKRRGVPRPDITALRAAYLMLKQGEGTFIERAHRVGDETDSDYVQQVVNFITAGTDRSFLTPK